MAFFNAQFNSPSVVLDHFASSSVSYLPSANALSIVFTSRDAYNKVQTTWSLDTNSDLLLVTYTPGCGNYNGGERCYFQVSGLNFIPNSYTVMATGTALSLENALNNATAEWGTYWPGDKGSSSPRNGKASGGANSTSNSTCGFPDTKYGLPTASPGINFDSALDDCLGYENINSANFAGYVTSIGGDDEDDPGYTNDASKGLEGDDYLLHFNATKHRRGLFSSIGSALTSVAQKLPIKGLTTPVTSDLFTKQFSFQLPKDQTVVNSPWGNANLLKEFGKSKDLSSTTVKGSSASSLNTNLKIYCVNCGAQGSITFAGKAAWSVLGGVSSGQLITNADINVVFKLGIDAQVQYQYQFTQQIGEFGIPGLSLPGAITIGPKIAIGTDINFNAAATGQILAGAQFGLQNAKSTIDIIDSSKSDSSGWTPVFTPTLEASGQIALSAEIGFPVSVSCGISIFNGKFNYDAGIIERPSIEAKAQFAGSVKGGVAAITATDGCAGIATQLTFKNWLYASVIGLKNFDLVKPYSKVLDKGCIKLPSASAATNTKTSRLRIRDDGNGTLTDITSLDNTTKSVIDNYSLPTINTTDYNTTDGYDYSTIVSLTGSYVLTSCSDSNLYLQSKTNDSTLESNSCSLLWQSKSNITVADGLGRLLHYYNNTMTTLGVSRLRVSDEENIPIGSVYVSLTPTDDDHNPSTPDLYYAVDSLKHAYYPIVCNYVDNVLPAKVFVANDPVKGLDLLMSADLEYTVTGGKVQSCYALGLVDEDDDVADFDDAARR